MILTLPFLAQRDYLHGTTLFDALSARLGAMAPLSLKIGRMIRSDRVCVEAAWPGGPTPAATFTVSSAVGGTETLGVYPADPSDRIERRPYDEEAVIRQARFEPDASRAILETPSPFSPIATLIPLNKLLLSRMPATAGIGQWLFSRIDLDVMPSSALPLALDFEGSLSGGRIARSRVQSGPRAIGTLYFSRRR